MAFKIKDGLRIGTVDVFNNSGVLQTAAIDTAVVVTLSGNQTLTNKTLTSPTLTAPVLGTPASGTLTNATGLPISTGVSGLGTGVATALAVNVGANGAVALYNGALGTPSSVTLTNATGLPISTGVTGLGTGVATALAVNVGSAGAVVTFNGALGTPSSGTLTNATGLPVATGISGLGTGVATFLATPSSSNLASAITDETGSGSLVFATSPTLVTPTLGVATATSINKVTITAPLTSSTLTIADGKTLTVSNTLTFTGTDTSSVAFGGGGTVAYTSNKLSAFAATSSSELAGVISDETGSGALVFANSPTLVTPALGTPSSATLTNATGLPVATGISGLGTGVATFLATPSSANLASALTDETGTGKVVFSADPTFTGTVNAANLTLTGNLTVGGTTTTVNSTNVSYTDSIIEIHNTTDSSPLLSDDGKDIGFRFHYFKTTNKNAFLGFANDTQYIEYYLTGTETAGVFSGTYGSFKGAGFVFAGSTSGSTIVNASATASGTLTLPAATDTLVGRATTDTLTNKTLTSPTLTTPVLGTPSSGTLTNCTGLPVSTGISGFGTGVATALAVNVGSAGAVVVNGGALGTPSSGTLTNATGLPVATGISGLGTGVATFLATPSSANLAAAITDETGTGALVFANSPTLVTPALGTPASGTLTNCTGLPVATGISGLGTGIATFLATPSSSNLAAALTDETGSGNILFNTAPTIKGAVTGKTSGGTTIYVQDAVQATVATTSATAVDTFAIATYRSVKYLVQITQGTNYQVSEIMVIHNGTTTTMTEYSVLETNGALGTFTSDISGGNARLLVTMGSATSATINIQKTTVAI